MHNFWQSSFISWKSRKVLRNIFVKFSSKTPSSFSRSISWFLDWSSSSTIWMLIPWHTNCWNKEWETTTFKSADGKITLMQLSHSNFQDYTVNKKCYLDSLITPKINLFMYRLGKMAWMEIRRRKKATMEGRKISFLSSIAQFLHPNIR